MSTQLPTYHQTPISSKDKETSNVIPLGVMAYFRGRLSNRIHELVLSEFAAQERDGKTSKAELSRRISRKPEQITRWLGSPGNWTLETLSDLLLGMNFEPEISFRSLKSDEVLHQNTWTQALSSKTYYSQLNVQTAQQVAQDFADGNHKGIYIRFDENINIADTSIIEEHRNSALTQPTFNVPISINGAIT